VIGVGRLTPIKRSVLRHRGLEMILTGMAQGSQPMVSKPVGVRTAWCVGVDTQADPEDATWQAVFEATRLQNCHGQGQITSEMQQYMKQRKGG
jgi:hypothetical protein